MTQEKNVDEQQLDELLEKAKKSKFSDADKMELFSLLNRLREKSEHKEKNDSVVCVCPFHEEKTPSFAINRETKEFHCFGCGVNGALVLDEKLKESEIIMRDDKRKFAVLHAYESVNQLIGNLLSESVGIKALFYPPHIIALQEISQYLLWFVEEYCWAKEGEF